MAKKLSGPQMIVANRLTDGRALFLTAEGWAVEPTHSIVAHDEDEVTALLAVANADVKANLVLAVEVVAADVGEGGVRPGHIKTQMQAKGPSVRTDLGYQVSPFWEN
ncbi:DUF2849 domain-containing protein [Gimibacter soli]|uniref:DUF2849 domain-containing protein n=1 Tax=Gimibacter soli TaxID=3024400 RepID=A0AAE9XVW2_9PROT|nr:DUF2849 domain-containing protein [Gimibacter soli]WCL55023.1 DUF2849 domain-containing protein [Gimibacter soli]